MSAKEFKIKKFNVARITKGSVIVMLGKRNTGKSVLVKDILYYKRDIPVGTVISSSEASNQFYGHIVPKLFIHDEYKTSVINNAVQRQELIMKKMNSEISEKGNSNIDPHAFIILDDCLFDSSWTRDVDIRKLFMNGRHIKVMFMITLQYPMGIPPILRTNVDFVFILRENNISNRKRIYDNYAGVFPNFEMFCQTMDQCTNDYECLVIDNTTQSNAIEDAVYWYKADIHDNFKIGAPEFWNYHNEKYDDCDGEQPFNVKEFSKPKYNINVIQMD